MTQIIKNCPFCGAEAELKLSYTSGSHHGRDDGYTQWTVRCTNCKISTSHAINDNEKRQILYFWNRRVL